MSGYMEGLLALLGINVILAYAAWLPMAAGQLNLGVAGFVAIGAYGAAWLSNELGWPPLAAAACAAALTGVAGLALAFPVLRTRGIYLALATFALGEVVQSGILNLDVVGGAAGYPVHAFLPAGAVVAVAAAVAIAVTLLSRTRFGLDVCAVCDDELVSELLGVPVRWIQSAAFALGCAVAALGGALYAHHFSYIEAQAYGVMFSIHVILFVLLGGTLTPAGPLAGAAVFTLLPELLRGSAGWRYVIFAVLIIAVTLWRPQGLLLPGMLRRVARGSAAP